MSKLTVVVPTYNRSAYLAECLASIAEQTYRSFQLVVLDNASTEDVGAVVARFESLGIHYIRNTENIGAARNIDLAREIGAASDYHIVFHDDDLMHPRMLERQVFELEARSDLAWIAAESAPFDGDSAAMQGWSDSAGDVEVYETRDALVRRLLENVPLNFGSVMYRSSISAGVDFRLDEFEIICDRVLLCDIAAAGPVAVIREPLVRYRHHEAQDSHNPIFREQHAMALMRYYKELLPAPLSAADGRLIERHSTNYLLHARSTVAPENRLAFRELTRAARADGLFRWSALDGQGVAALADLAGVGTAYGAVRPALGRIKRSLQG